MRCRFCGAIITEITTGVWKMDDRLDQFGNSYLCSVLYLEKRYEWNPKQCRKYQGHQPDPEIESVKIILTLYPE